MRYDSVGELLFRTRDQGVAVVCVHRGESCFRITRRINYSSIEQIEKVDSYNGDITGYILEATLKWTDLEREGVQWKRQAEARDLHVAGQVGTF